MEYEIEQNGSEWTFKPVGAVRIADADELKNLLLKAMSSFDTIRIDVSRLEGMDLSVMQILCSSHRTATMQGKTFSFSGDRRPSLISIIRLMGFDRDTGCRLDQTQTCIWKGWNN